MSIPLNISTGWFSTSGNGLGSLSNLITDVVGFHFTGGAYLSIIPFVGIVAASPMFLLLMGLEMGALVVFRMKRIKWLEKRINLSFALIAYFTYTLYGPSYILGWRNLPLWANVGALGSVRGALILPLLLSYLVYAILALLFGDCSRRLFGLHSHCEPAVDVVFKHLSTQCEDFWKLACP